MDFGLLDEDIILDRINRIDLIYLLSQFPDETEKMQSAFGGQGLLSLLGLPVLSFDLYAVWTKVYEQIYLFV